MQGFSPAAENNKSPILDVLTSYLRAGDNVLEIGSGSGQHAIHMATSLPDLHWQPSEQTSVLPLLNQNVRDFGPANLNQPCELDLAQLPDSMDMHLQCVYSANVIHIVSEALGENLITWSGDILSNGGYLVLYGPYKYGGEFTTPSNANFDLWLKDRNAQSGIRDFEWVNQLANLSGMELLKDHAMPSNNQCLVFKKSSA